MKCPFEEATEISLDDYVKKYVKGSTNADFKKNKNVCGDSDMDVDNSIQNIKTEDCPNKSYVNWRLLPENVLPEKPLFMPPLIPKNRNQNNRRWHNRGNNNKNKSRNKNSRNNSSHNSNNNSSQNSNFRNRMNPIHQNKHRNNTGGLFTQNYLNKNNNVQNGPKILRNFNGVAIPDLKPHSPMLNHSHMLQNSSAFSSTLSLDRTSMNTAQSFQSLLDPHDGPSKQLVSGSQTWSSTEMAAIADNLLSKFGKINELTQSLRVAEEQRNKYNLKIQKEIAQLQKKTLFIKCPDAQVITSDGPGLFNCQPKPQSTDLSMNLRFA